MRRILYSIFIIAVMIPISCKNQSKNISVKTANDSTQNNIIFNGEKAVSGRVIDGNTREPLSGASIEAKPAQYAIGTKDTTGSDGIFSITILSDNGYEKLDIKVRKEDYYARTLSIDVPIVGNKKDIGDIELYFASFRLPLPDSGKSLSPIKEREIKNRPYISTPVRTVRPPCMPSKYYHTYPDSDGGLWVIFPMRRDPTPIYFVTYMNKDGSMERSCPIGELGYKPKIELKPDGLNLRSRDYQDDTTNIKYTLEMLRTDSDNDSIPDFYEEYYCLNSRDRDTDGDGLDDLNDPFPTIKGSSKENETAAIYVACIENYEYINIFGLNNFNAVLKALPDNARGWLLGLKFKSEESGKRYNVYNLNLEDILITMKPDELRKIYPLLKSLSMKAINPDTVPSNNFNEIFCFPYLEKLKNARKSNLDEIRRTIMWTYSQYFISPISLKGGIESSGIGALPIIGDYMYITGCEKKSRAYAGYYGFSIKKSDSIAAIVKADLSVIGYEYLLVKRDGKWIKVSSVMTWIS